MYDKCIVYILIIMIIINVDSASVARASFKYASIMSQAYCSGYISYVYSYYSSCMLYVICFKYARASEARGHAPIV